MLSEQRNVNFVETVDIGGLGLKVVYRDLNNLVMDFLVKEGYPAAAARFAEEANIELKEDDAEMPQRVIIKNAIHRGDIQTAIEEINELSPQVRTTTPQRFTFHDDTGFSCTTHSLSRL